MNLKIKPNNKEIEASVIGVLLVEPKSIPEHIGRLFEDLFYDDFLRSVFVSIKNLYNQNKMVDILTVFQEMKPNNQDLAPYQIVELTNRVSSSAHIVTWVDILEDEFLKRQCQELSYELNSKVDTTTDITETINEHSSKIIKAQEKIFKINGKSIIDYLVDLNKQREQAKIKGTVGIPTGYQVLNKNISGWVAPDFCIIAARPGQGKTAFMINTIDFMCKNNNSVGVFSLEMSGEQLANRIVSLHSDFPVQKLNAFDFTENELKEITRIENNISKYKLFIDDSASLNVRELRSKSHILKQRQKVDIIFIDYLQLMSGENRNENREREISNISRTCKIIAKELNIPVIALSQLSRECEKRPDKMPQLSDLRESGSIEQDADSVIFLMRPETYGINEIEIEGQIQQTSGLAVLKLAKNRHGSMKLVTLKFTGNCMKFSEQQFTGVEF